MLFLAAQWFGRARYGTGTGAILLDQVSCNGSETRLSNCSHMTKHDCLHSEDVGVRCEAVGHRSIVGGGN